MVMGDVEMPSQAVTTMDTCAMGRARAMRCPDGKPRVTPRIPMPWGLDIATGSGSEWLKLG